MGVSSSVLVDDDPTVTHDGDRGVPPGVPPPKSLTWPSPVPVPAGDQIVSATVYFDNLQSGEVAQLLQTMGHHTVGLRLQRRGDRSPLPGQPCGHEAFVPGSPEVVLVSGGDGGRRRRVGMKMGMRRRMKMGMGMEEDGDGGEG